MHRWPMVPVAHGPCDVCRCAVDDHQTCGVPQLVLLGPGAVCVVAVCMFMLVCCVSCHAGCHWCGVLPTTLMVQIQKIKKYAHPPTGHTSHPMLFTMVQSCARALHLTRYLLVEADRGSPPHPRDTPPPHTCTDHLVPWGLCHASVAHGASGSWALRCLSMCCG